MSKQKNNSISKELEIAKKQGANLLMPTTNIHGLSEFMTPVVESVYLSVKPEDGDVYAADAKFRITAQGLRKLAVCAGIIWHPTACCRTDNRNDRDYVSYQSVGGIKKNDGSLVYWKGEYDLDFEVVAEELKELHYKKSKNWQKSDEEKQAYIESSVRRDMIFKRKHKIKLAETGAANRVIRAILGLKSAYTKAELAKPFTLIRIVFKPDYNDPEVKRQVTAAAISAMTGIYGSQLPPLAPPIDIPPENFHEIPPDAEDSPSSDDDQTTKEEEKPESPTGEEVFKDLSAKEQVETLTQMAELKGYKPKQPVNGLGKKERLSFFVALEQMPDVEMEIFVEKLIREDKVKEEDVPY